MKIFFFVSILLLSCSFGFSSSNTAGLTECPTPENVSVVSQSTNAVSFDWDDCGCAFTEYRVFFVKGGQASTEYSSTTSNISFTGLSAGMYRFYFYTVCEGGVSSIIIDDIVIG